MIPVPLKGHLSHLFAEKYVDPAVKAILQSAKTGDIGDGKIFISEIVDAYRIRTEERGDKAMYLEGEE